MDNTTAETPIRHNIGLARTFDGISVCHSIWNDDTLVLKYIWSSATLLEETLFDELDRIIQSYPKEQTHHSYFYVGDNTLRWAHPTVGGLETKLARMEEDTKKVRRVDAPLTIKFSFHANAKTHR